MNLSFIGDNVEIKKEHVAKELDDILSMFMNCYAIDKCYVGNETEFDFAVVEAVKRAKERQPDIKCVLVPLSEKTEYDESLYDEVERVSLDESCIEWATVERNEYMITQSKTLVYYFSFSCYLSQAFRAAAVAKKLGKTVFEIY